MLNGEVVGGGICVVRVWVACTPLPSKTHEAEKNGREGADVAKKVLKLGELNTCHSDYVMRSSLVLNIRANYLSTPGSP